jgi:hypothetical protein
MIRELYLYALKLPEGFVAMVGAANLVTAILVWIQVISGILAILMTGASLFILWPKLRARWNEIRDDKA